MKSIEQIDEEIAKRRKIVAKLEAERERNAARLEQARATREKLSLAALTGRQEEARALEEARFDQRDAELTIEDTESAIGQANREIEALRAEREEAQRAAHWQAFEKVSNEATATAAKIDAAITALGNLLQNHLGQLRKMTELSAAAGRPRIFGSKHIWRVINARFHKILPHEFPNQHAFYRDRSWETILRDQIDGAGEQQERTGEAQAS